MVDEDEVKGKIKQSKGKIREEVGEEVKGKMKQAEGKIQEKVGEMKRKVKEEIDD